MVTFRVCSVRGCRFGSTLGCVAQISIPRAQGCSPPLLVASPPLLMGWRRYPRPKATWLLAQTRQPHRVQPLGMLMQALGGPMNSIWSPIPVRFRVVRGLRPPATLLTTGTTNAKCLACKEWQPPWLDPCKCQARLIAFRQTFGQEHIKTHHIKRVEECLRISVSL